LEYLALDFVLNPNKRVFYLYILSSIFLAILYFYYTKKSTKLILSSKLWLHPSAKLDYYYFILANIVNIVFIVPLIFSAKNVALNTNKFLHQNFGYFENTIFSYSQIILLYTICIFVFSDFTRYFLHRFLHTIPILWEFHKVHHSARVLTPITFYRIHPVENLLFGLRYSLSVGFVTGIFIYLFGAKIDIYTFFGVNVFIFIFSIFGSNLRHSHIAFAYFSFIEKWFISPKQHQIHHDKRHFNKNYGGYIAFWDRVFGTLALSKDVKILKFGIQKDKMDQYLTIKDLYLRPFINLIKKGKFYEKFKNTFTIRANICKS